MNQNENKSAQPVDVLAVMDDCAGSLSKLGSAGMVRASELREARAAVAELVDKADNAARVLHNAISAKQIDKGYQSILDDLDAALARVQGGAA